MEAISQQILAALLISLRIGPTLAFAPPFTLIRIPVLPRTLLGLIVANLMFQSILGGNLALSTDLAWLGPAAAGELLIGIALAASLQLAFAAVQVAGQTIDIQAGYGFAGLADPTLRTQTPLIASLFTYTTAAVFFGVNGPQELLGLWAKSVETIPIGAFAEAFNPLALASFLGVAFGLGLGLAGVAILVLFAVDLGLALMSRTLPQMNMLILGFQAKTLVALIVLPFLIAHSAAGLLRLLRLALTAPTLYLGG
jgi:flagellar biosynthetic protein FliR